jgi:hypothetical protein
MPEIKMPTQHLLNASLDMLRLRGDITDAVVVLVNERTQDCKIGSMRGDMNHTIAVLERTLNALKKRRMKGNLTNGGIIVPG